MAQVTMTSQEYLELIEKVRRLEQLEQDIVNGVDITLNPEGAFNKYSIQMDTVMTRETEKRVVRKIIDTIKKVDYVMDELVGENQHFFNPHNSYISSHWDDKPELGDIDLLTDKEFKAAWEAAKARLAESITEEE